MRYTDGTESEYGSHFLFNYIRNYYGKNIVNYKIYFWDVQNLAHDICYNSQI